MKIIFDISMKLPKLIEKRTKFPKHKFQQWSAEFLEGKGEAKSWLRMAKWWRKSELQPYVVQDSKKRCDPTADHVRAFIQEGRIPDIKKI